MTKELSLSDLPPGGEEEAAVLRLVDASYLEAGFSSRWRPAKVQLVTNGMHQDEYDAKKAELSQRGRTEEELETHHGFLVENNIAGLDLITTIGLQTRDSEYNALGYNRMGVYLCRHGDVCLQHALVKYSGTPVIRVVVCKFMVGRSTTAIPRVASAAEFIEPTQGFECHTSVIPPNPKDSLQNQFDRSQVYLYEISKLLQPGACPRHAMPYAVVHYTEDGAYTPLIDAEATPAEKLADNPRLQQIVAAINSKDDDPTPSTSPATIPVITGRPPRPPGLPKALPFLPAGLELMGSPHLQRAITQLTAKLEAEERTKKAAGPDIIAKAPPPAPPGLPPAALTPSALAPPAYTPAPLTPTLGQVPQSLAQGLAGLAAPQLAAHGMPCMTGLAPGLAQSLCSPGLGASSLGLAHGALGLRLPTLPARPSYPPAAPYQPTALSTLLPGYKVSPGGAPGLLGSMPPSGFTRSSPLMSRSLTPDMTPAGLLTTSVAPPGSLLAPGHSGLFSGSLPPGQLAPAYTMAAYGGLQYEPAPAPKDVKPAPALYYQVPGPAVSTAPYPQTLVLNQPLKRPLDIAHGTTVDKRIKFY